MYYLLEDNRIIDSNNIENEDSNYKVKNGKLQFLLGVNISNEGTKYIYRDVNVKKQSENVFDLIEKGDVVNYNGNLYEVKKFEIERKIVYMDTALGICMPSVTRFMELLNAIYKPDAKGNYIKVWEVKEDE